MDDSLVINDLQNRIAAVIERNLLDQSGIELPERYREWICYEILADAVIRELGLREEEDGTGDFGYHTRYVTKWSDE